MHFNGTSKHGFDVRIDIADWNTVSRQHPPYRRRSSQGLSALHRPARRLARTRVVRTLACRPKPWNRLTSWTAPSITCKPESTNRPFAMVVSFYEPHAPFRFPHEWQGRYRPDQFSAPTISQRDREQQPTVFRDLTSDDFRGIQAAYYTSLSFWISRSAGLIQALEDSGLGPDTLVVFLSDNGYSLGQHGRFEKHCFYEPAVRVPLILRWPGHLPQKGESSRSPSSSISSRPFAICSTFPGRRLARDGPRSSDRGVNLGPRGRRRSSASITRVKRPWSGPTGTS